MDSPTSPRLRVAFLGSGSAGNATAVAWGDRCVLVDCGFSARETVRRLEACGLSRESVEAVVLTHEHGDHVRGIDVFSRRHGVPVFATSGTLRAGGFTHLDTVALHAEETISIGPFRVRTFATSHDVTESIGCTFHACCGGSFGLATDTGVISPEALDALAECELVGLETNHDVRMLMDGPYPGFLKRRILSDRGHLSNADAAATLQAFATGATRRVVAMHLSRTNNTRRAALAALRAEVEREDLPLRVHAADQDEPLVPEVPAA